MLSTHSSTPPVPRALSLTTPLVHHPPLWEGDTHHLVSLTSTAYCSLVLIDTKTPEMNGEDFFDHHPNQPPQQDSPVHAEQDESSSPDSVINAWELMDGLDDDCDFDMGTPNCFVNNCTMELSSKSNIFNCKGLDVPVKKYEDYKPTNKPSLTKPLWKHLSEESLLSKLDPNVLSSYRRALSSRQLGSNESGSTISVGSRPPCSSLSDSWVRVPSTENRILLYFTSLRGIRKTYEDCCCVRMIFRGFGVLVDEREISMDSMYRNELESLVGGKVICLSQVFIRGKHVGGVEEIKELNDSGELAKLLEGFPVRDPRIVCEVCGDARFVKFVGMQGLCPVLTVMEAERCMWMMKRA